MLEARLKLFSSTYRHLTLNTFQSVVPFLKLSGIRTSHPYSHSYWLTCEREVNRYSTENKRKKTHLKKKQKGKKKEKMKKKKAKRDEEKEEKRERGRLLR